MPVVLGFAIVLGFLVLVTGIGKFIGLPVDPGMMRYVLGLCGFVSAVALVCGISLVRDTWDDGAGLGMIGVGVGLLAVGAIAGCVYFL